MPEQSPLPPANWYPDPNDSSKERWWEGTQWTDRLRDASSSYLSPPPSLPVIYAGEPVPSTSGSAVTVMILGIASIFVTFFFLFIGLAPAIIALMLAPKAKKEVEASSKQGEGNSYILVGKICAWVTIGMQILFALFFLGLIFLIFVGIMTSPDMMPSPTPSPTRLR